MTHDQLLEEFVSKYDLRPALIQPNRVGDFIYSSDGYAMLIIDGRLTQTPFYPHPKAPSFEQIIPKESMSAEYAVDEIKRALGSFEKEDVFGDCAQCGGDGEVLCRCCNNVGDCDECNGTGKNSEVVGSEYHYEDAICFIDSVYLAPASVEKMMLVCDVENAQSVRLLAGGEKTPNLFEVGRCRVLIMPKLLNNGRKVIRLTETIAQP